MRWSSGRRTALALAALLLAVGACNRQGPVARRRRRTAPAPSPSVAHHSAGPTLPEPAMKRVSGPVEARREGPKERAEESYRKALELVRREEYERAQALALEARRILEEAPGFSTDREAHERVRRINELIVLCRKSVAGAGATGATPHPVPYNSLPWGAIEIPGPGDPRPPASPGSGRSRPAKPAPPAWDVLGRLAGLFRKAVGGLGPTGFANAEEAAALEKELAARLPAAGKEQAPFVLAMYAVVRMVRSKVWNVAEDEAAAVGEYCDRFLLKAATMWDTQAIRFLLDKHGELLMSLPGTRREAVRWMALAHVERLLSTGFSSKVELTPAEENALGLVRSEDGWKTREGRFVESVRALEPEDLLDQAADLVGRKEPELRLFLFRHVLLQAYETVDPQRAGLLAQARVLGERVGIDSPGIQAQVERVRSVLRGFKSSSTGRRRHRIRWPRRRDAGRPAAVPRSPALEELAHVEDCSLCHATGFVWPKLNMPCPDCFGTGRRFEAVWK